MFVWHQRNNTFCFSFESHCAYKYCLTPAFAWCFQHPWLEILQYWIFNICLFLRSSITRTNFHVCWAMSKEKLYIVCKLKAASSWPIQFSILTVEQYTMSMPARSKSKNKAKQWSSAQNFCFRNSLEWSIYIHNSIGKTTLSCNTPHQCSTSFSLETYIARLYSLFDQESYFFLCFLLQGLEP